jgi:ADP-heptose:LPS heptosyltransferase
MRPSVSFRDPLSASTSGTVGLGPLLTSQAGAGTGRSPAAGLIGLLQKSTVDAAFPAPRIRLHLHHETLMNIVISNPDAIGDMILRQPFYAALREAGHELLLLVQPLVMPFAQLVAPGAAYLTIPAEPYTFRPDHAAEALEEFVGRVRAFHPDALVLAPYLWTAFEEHLASVLPGVPVLAMTGFPFAGPVAADARSKSRIVFAEQVAVDPWSHELEKNRRLAELILKRSVPFELPRLAPSTKQLAGARYQLAGLGLTVGHYWVACVGEGPRTIQRNWPVEKWAAALRHGIAQHGQRFLLIGDAAERASLQQILGLMGPLADAVAVLPPGQVDADFLVGATAMSEGYIGRDTGPMHLAAALGRPVLAVYWGAHWPRFTPAASAARALTLDVPCRGCEGFCHLKQSHCVKEVPVTAVLAAMDELTAGAGGCQSRTLPRPADVGVRMEVEAALTARERLALVDQLEAERSQLLQEVEMLREVAAAEWALRIPAETENRDSENSGSTGR